MDLPFWGDLAPITETVVWDGAPRLVTFQPLDVDAERGVLRATEHITDPTERFVAGQHLTLARALVAVDGQPIEAAFATTEERETWVGTYPGALVSACWSAYKLACNRPVEALAALESDPK